ncbi:MAG: YihY/virulence factor BrkB family protein [Balneolaceae bacterium]
MNKIKELITATFYKALEDDIMTQGAAIAFYTIFSVAPLFILIVSLSGLFFSEEMITEQLQFQLQEFLGEDIATNLNQFLAQSSQLQSGALTSIIASIIVIFGATTVISQLKLTLNRIWNIGEVKIHSVWHFLLNRLLSFGMIILFSLLLLTSLIAEAIIGLISAMFLEILPNVPIDFYQYLSQITTIGFAVIFFTLIFKILPDVHAHWLDVMVGALVTTLLFLLGKYLIGLYLSASGIQTAYRAAGSLVVFVIWVYYNVQSILLGAVFTQVYTDMFGGGVLPYKFVEFRGRERNTERLNE